MTSIAPAADFAAFTASPVLLPVVETGYAAQAQADAADPIVAYEYDNERACPRCADEHGIALDERYRAVRRSQFTADRYEHSRYRSGRCCAYCGETFPGEEVSATECPCSADHGMEA